MEQQRLDHDIQALQKGLTATINALHNDMKEINKSIQAVSVMPAMLQEFQKTVVGQFQALFINQVETEAVTRQANMMVLNEKISLLENLIVKQKKQLEETKVRLEERYTRLLGSLQEQHEHYLKRLDGHVFDITERVFPNEIQKKFSFSAIPAQHLLAATSEQDVQIRARCIQEGFDLISSNIECFLQSRANSYDQLPVLSADDVPPGDYEVPFWVVETEEMDTGRKQKQVFFAWELQNGNSEPPNQKERLRLYDAATAECASWTPEPFTSDEGAAIVQLLDSVEGERVVSSFDFLGSLQILRAKKQQESRNE